MTPTPGTPATVVLWSDRHAATVTHVSKSGRTVTVRTDTVRRADNNGMSDDQTWEVVEEATGQEQTFTLRKNGKWAKKGDPMNGGTRLTLGSRNHHYDFSF